MTPRGNSRQRILDAATELAGKEGSAHLSLDAVAALAGVSKGGLLYNFPTKNALLKALVQQYIDDFRTALYKNTETTNSKQIAQEYFSHVVDEINCQVSPPSGLLAAVAEDPDFLSPVREFNRQLLDHLNTDSSEDANLLIAFLAVEGLRAHRLLGINVLEQREYDLVLKQLKARLQSI